jgi:hypothetical protein
MFALLRTQCPCRSDNHPPCDSLISSLSPSLSLSLYLLHSVSLPLSTFLPSSFLYLFLVSQTHHPQHYEFLLSKWRKFYPESVISSGPRSDQPYVPPSLSSSSSSLKNPMQSAPFSTQKKFQKNMYSSLPVAADEEDPQSTLSGEDGDDEEETVQLNNVPLSLSELMALSKNTVNSAMNIAIQGKNSLSEFISSSQQSNEDSQGTTRVHRGSYGPAATGSAPLPRQMRTNVPSEDTLSNSML